MARARDPNRKLAFNIYEKSDGKIDLVDIADKLGLPAGTIRGWKSKDKWEQKLNGTLQKDMERSNKNTERSNRKIRNEKDADKAVVREVELVMENPDLTDKQRLFCLYFAKSFNATKSYQKAYGVSYEVAMAAGSQLLRNCKIKQEIDRLKRERYTNAYLSAEDIVEKFIEIAFSDVGDYLEFKTENVPVISQSGKVVKVRGSDGVERALSKTVNVVRFKNSSDLDTSILAEVKQGKDGASVKLPDKLKALEWLANNLGMMTEEQKAKVAKLKAETDKITGDNQEIEDLDGIEADIYGD